MDTLHKSDKWTKDYFHITKSLGSIQPMFQKNFHWPLMLDFQTTDWGLKSILQFSPYMLTDTVIDDPDFIPALKHARDFAQNAHPGLRFEVGMGSTIIRARGLASIITIEGINDLEEVRISKTNYDHDRSIHTDDLGTFVNKKRLTYGAYKQTLESEKHVSGLKHQANTLMEQCKVLTDQIVEAKIELDKRFARLDELDTLLSYDYPTMALDDVRPEPVVYFIREAVHTGLVKVGKTNNLHNRLPGLGETKGPVRFDYQIVHVIYTRHNDALERQLHRRFADKRRHGEWFALTPEDIAAIQGDYGTRWERT